MFNKKLQKFSIRKLTVGAASVLIGISFVSMRDNNTVHAADMPVATTAQTSQDKLSAANDQASLKNETNQSASLQQDVNVKQKEAAEALANAQKAQDQTDQAKKAWDEAQSKAQGKDQAEKEVANRQTEVDQTKNALEQATEQNKQIKADETKKKEEISNQNKEISKNQDNLIDAEKDQTVAQNKLNDAQINVKQKDDSLKDINDKLNDAQDELNKSNNNLSKIQAEKQDADQQLTNDQSALENAKLNVKNEKNNVANAQNNLMTRTSEKNQADNTVNSAQSDLDSANSVLDQAQKDAQPYTDQLKTLNDQLNYLNEMTKDKIDLVDSEEYKKAMIKWLNATEDQQNNNEVFPANTTDPNTRELVDYLEKAHKANTHYKETDPETGIVSEYFGGFNSSNYDSRKINISDTDQATNLTDDDVIELSLFAQDLINQVRHQLNPEASDVKVTKGSIEFTKEIANQYIKDINDGAYPYNNADPHWHDCRGINSVAQKNHMEAGVTELDPVTGLPKVDRQPYEDSGYGRERSITMNELKDKMYNFIMECIVPNEGTNGYTSATTGKKVDYELGHARGLIGLDSFNLSRNNLIEVLNDINSHDYISWTRARGSLDEVTIPINQEKENIQNLLNDLNNNKFNKNAFDDPYIGTIATKDFDKGEDILHVISVYKSQLPKNTNFDFTEIPSYQEQITSIRNKIDDVTNQAQPLLDALKNAKDVVNEKQNALDDANSSLSTATAAYNQATKDLKDANDVLSTAQNKVRDLQTRIESDNTAVENENSQLEVATQNVDKQQEELRDAKRKQSVAEVALKTANDNLYKAQNNMTKANQNVEDITSSLKENNTKLRQLKNELDNLVAKEALLPVAQQKANQAQNDLKNAQAKLDQIQTAIQDAQSKQETYKKSKEISDRLTAISKQAQTDLEKAKMLASANHAYEAAKNSATEYVNNSADYKTYAGVEGVKNAKASLDKAISTGDKASTVAGYTEATQAVNTAKGALENAVAQAKKDADTGNSDSSNTDNPTDSNGNSSSTDVSSEEEPMTGVAHIKDTVTLVNGKGELSDQTIEANSDYKVFAKKTINGKVYYRLGTDNQWVVADAVAYITPDIVTDSDNAETPFAAIGYIPVLKNHPTWKIALVDGKGNYTGQYLAPNTNWKVFAKKIINGQTYYRLGTDQQWISAAFLQIKTTGTVKTNPVKNHPTWKIALLNQNGEYTGEFVKPNTSWKVWDVQFINGRMMARIGNQAQWIPMEFTSWVK